VIEKELVYGDQAVRLLYQTKAGQVLADRVLCQPWFSQLYGAYQSSRLSASKVEPFIRRFGIPMEEFEPGPYQNFNEFFVRKFQPGKRPFVRIHNEMGAFAEARYLAFDQVTPELKVPVKGKWLAPSKLLGDAEKSKLFEGGPLLLARLCPTDYHRFHFPDSGELLDFYTLQGALHSVNPLALKYKGDIFITNERQVSILETDNFGKLAYIEVGALCVGKIVQTFKSETHAKFRRGEEKGYFLFGGSTVIVLGQPGKWKPSADLLEQTRMGRETLVPLGTSVGTA
jgi:phosphatidylserine decarboxylase